MVEAGMAAGVMVGVMRAAEEEVDVEAEGLAAAVMAEAAWVVVGWVAVAMEVKVCVVVHEVGCDGLAGTVRAMVVVGLAQVAAETEEAVEAA